MSGFALPISLLILAIFLKAVIGKPLSKVGLMMALREFPVDLAFAGIGFLFSYIEIINKKAAITAQTMITPPAPVTYYHTTEGCLFLVVGYILMAGIVVLCKNLLEDFENTNSWKSYFCVILFSYLIVGYSIYKVAELISEVKI